MQKYADYIKQIEIESLWSGTKHILWNLDRRVNILSGVNGVGKSTILNKVVKGLAAGGEFPSHMIKGVHLKVEPEEAKWIRYDVIRSVDRPLMNAEMINRIDLTLVTELDWQLFQLQRKYLDYQVNIGNRIIAVLQSGEPDAAFKQIGEQLSPYQLSAGEKQILAILLTVLVEDNQSYVLFMDEPEISLHFEWQKQLIGLVLQLNPNIQIIMTTHSPAVVMDGWTDRVTDVSDITI